MSNPDVNERMTAANRFLDTKTPGEILRMLALLGAAMQGELNNLQPPVELMPLVPTILEGVITEKRREKQTLYYLVGTGGTTVRAIGKQQRYSGDIARLNRETSKNQRIKWRGLLDSNVTPPVFIIQEVLSVKAEKK